MAEERKAAPRLVGATAGSDCADDGSAVGNSSVAGATDSTPTVASFWGDEVAELEPTLDEEDRLDRLARTSNAAAASHVALHAGKSESESDPETESKHGSRAGSAKAATASRKYKPEGGHDGADAITTRSPRKLTVLELRHRMEFFASIAKGHMGEVRMALKPTCKKGSVPMIPDVNCRDESSGRTAVHFAAQHNQVEILRELVDEFNANVNVQDNEGATPICVAAANNNVSCVQALLLRGADQSITTSFGATPDSLAKELGLHEVLGVLRGALPPPEEIPGVLKQKVPDLVLPPEALPVPGIYNSPLKIVLFSKTPGAVIHGTADPTVPCRDFPALADTVTLEVDTTEPNEETRVVWFRAIAQLEGVGSDMKVFEYRLRSPLSQWWSTMPQYLRHYQEMFRAEGYDTLEKFVHRLSDPMEWRADMKKIGVHADYHRAELMRHMRGIPTDKWRKYLPDTAPEGPIDIPEPEDAEYDRAVKAALEKAAKLRAKDEAAAAALAASGVAFPSLPRHVVREAVERNTRPLRETRRPGDGTGSGEG